MIAETIVAAALAVAPAHSATAPPYTARYEGCRTASCDARVLRRHRRASWARRHPWQHERNRMFDRQPWLRSALAALRGCETNGLPFPENYRIGPGHPRWNGHDGAYQYDRRTWWETLAVLPRRLARRAAPRANLATPAEQDVRTGRWWPSHRGRWQCRV